MRLPSRTLFPDDFYLRYVNRAYEKELDGKPLSTTEMSANAHLQLVRRIDAALKARGLQPNSEGCVFNKGRPAKLLLAELSKSSVSELPSELVSRFERLFQRINDAMPELQSKP
jgi:hypothetical protein